MLNHNPYEIQANTEDPKVPAICVVHGNGDHIAPTIVANSIANIIGMTRAIL